MMSAILDALNPSRKHEALYQKVLANLRKAAAPTSKSIGWPSSLASNAESICLAHRVEVLYVEFCKAADEANARIAAMAKR